MLVLSTRAVISNNNTVLDNVNMFLLLKCLPFSLLLQDASFNSASCTTDDLSSYLGKRLGLYKWIAKYLPAPSESRVDITVANILTKSSRALPRESSFAGIV